MPPVSRQPRVLLLLATSSYRADDFLDAARHIGVDVVVGSDHRQALAAHTPDATLRVDFGDVDASVARIAELHGRAPLDAIVAAEDDGAVLAAAAAERLELPHNPPASVRAARYKDRLRAALSAAGLPSPAWRVIPVETEAGAAARLVADSPGYPCVLKPTFLSASRGVIRADDEAAFAAAWRRVVAILEDPALRRREPDASRRVLVEAYVPGREAAVEGLLTDGRLDVIALFDKPDPLEGPYFEETLYVRPSRLPDSVQRDVRRVTAEACRALGLSDGPVHAELRHDGRRAWLIEVAPRSIGGLCSRVLRFGAGFTLESLILSHALRRARAGTAGPGTAEPAGPPATGVMMLPVPGAGELLEVAGVDAARAVAGVDGVTILVRPGEVLVPPPEGHRYPGFIFAHGETPAAVERALREAHSLLEFRLGGG